MSENTTGGRQNRSGEHADLIAQLDRARQSLRGTVSGLSDEEARRRTTVSDLCLGGLIKHVTAVEQLWANFLTEGRWSALPDFADLTEADWARHAEQFRMMPGETLSALLADYDVSNRRFDTLIATQPDLDITLALPESPFFTEKHWTVRRVLLHVMLDTAQHAGHADIIREALDGKKSTG
ncbi:DinB family protein [Streptomyces sp. MMBL 11-3]|uniref:DinB family protein n=1 Tax=Streptomyces sp. MMBL 11-3 TaxID=3382639 RepID=UPI0039B482ED